MAQVGTMVRLKVDCLGNARGTRGVCFHVYELDLRGAQFIFENGNYDGFSEEDQRDFLEDIGVNEELSTYQFKHVIQVGRDFTNKLFNKALTNG